MKIVFFGSAHFAVPSMRALAEAGHTLLCLVTQPDKKCGRGLPLCCTCVKEEGQRLKVPVFQPEDVNVPSSVKFLKDAGAELFVVIAYGQLLSKAVLDIPAKGAVNIHASYLPHYRGAAPINWSIIKGDTSTGVTAIKMTEKMDAGPVILQDRCVIDPDDTALTLEDRLSRQATTLLLKAVEAIGSSAVHMQPQDENMVTYAPKLKKSDGRIDWSLHAGQVNNLIKGCLGWPGAYTYLNKRLLKIYKATPALLGDFPPDPEPGQVVSVSKERLLVACGKDGILIEELQIEGKRSMKIKEFLAGHKVTTGFILGQK